MTYDIGMLSDLQVTKFQKIYRAKFGMEISREAALDKGLKLVNLMALIYKPMLVEDYKKVVERQRQLQKL